MFFALKFTKLLGKLNRFEEAEKIMEQCVLITEKMKSSVKLEELINECNYVLAVNHLKKG